MQGPAHLNPVVELLTQRRPVFGLYAPRNPGAGGRGGLTWTPEPAHRAPAREAARRLTRLRRRHRRSWPARRCRTIHPITSSTAAWKAISTARSRRSPNLSGARSTAELSSSVAGIRSIVKTHRIAPDPALAAAAHRPTAQPGRERDRVRGGRERARRCETGLAAMRFRSQGGTRRTTSAMRRRTGAMSEAEYRGEGGRVAARPQRRAGELDDRGEQGRAGARARDRGGAGNRRAASRARARCAASSRRPMSTGQRVFDEQGWEGAIQQVLAACKELQVPCGYRPRRTTSRSA